MDAGLTNCTENRDCDPMLADPGSGDFHLLPGSCCIDTGNPLNAPSEDFEGDPRPSGSNYDIGADEYMTPRVPVQGILCLIVAFPFILLIVRNIL